jgi:hypothetical protein
MGSRYPSRGVRTEVKRQALDALCEIAWRGSSNGKGESVCDRKIETVVEVSDEFTSERHTSAGELVASAQ